MPAIIEKEKNNLIRVGFFLNNEYRKYFGLNLIEDHWEKVLLEERMYLYFEGDIIKKIIVLYPTGIVNYREIDNEVHTQNREMILPKTSRGKAKRLTAARLECLTPTGCSFWTTVTESGSTVYAGNERNTKCLPITGASNIKSVKELYKWIDEYIRTCPPDYFEKVEKMKNSPHITVRYQPGDIFRFELDRENYGFGIIIGEIRKLEKEGVFKKGHPILSTMCVPLLVRLYLLKTTDKNMTVEDISRYPLLPSQVVLDDDIIWGKHDIIGSRKLEEEDMDLPLYLIWWSAYPQIFWGSACIETSKTIEFYDMMQEDRNRFRRCSGSWSIPIHCVEDALEGKSTLEVSSDLRHEENRSIKEKIFSLFGLPRDIDYDEFNRKNNGMTRKEFAEYLNKRRKQVNKRS